MLKGPCPIHGGRRPDAFNIYPDGHTYRGNWACRSRGCHSEFRPTIIGFTWGVLSYRAGWRNPGDKKVPFKAVLDFLCDFVGQKLRDIKINDVEVEKKTFIAQMESIGKAPQAASVGWARSSIRARMDCPAGYYLGRGYSREILERYDVGIWAAGKAVSPMSGRAAVPVFDDEHGRVVGVTGRSVYDRCARCRQWHDAHLACSTLRNGEHAKWFNVGFQKESHLYNYWFARTHIRSSGVAILVEGPGDVWRLEEAGIHNAVALFGCEVSDRQEVILEKCGASHIVLFPHNDEAGRHSRDQVEKEMGKLYNLHFYDLPEKDVGEMSVSEIRSGIAPFLKGIG